MYNRASDLNDFYHLCKKLEEDDLSLDDVDQSDDSNDDISGLPSSPYLGRVKLVIKAFQKIGGRIEDLVRDKDTPEDLRNYLIDLDKMVSSTYMKLYQFGHQVKVKDYNGSNAQDNKEA